ncbi:MAG: hypothetical protein HKN91_16385 [Acidimicrobiia bacterium]|nr:hypothetical protein [Acidimicrobiia bacterium]
MHLHRLLALAGVAIGVVGLFFSGLTTAGEPALAALSQQEESLPDGIPTIWGGLEVWAQVILVLLIAVVVWTSVRPYVELTFLRSSAIVVTSCGVVMFAYAAIKYIDAFESADTLETGFWLVAESELRGVSAWSVAPGIGFFVLLLGTFIVALSGVLSLISAER